MNFQNPFRDPPPSGLGQFLTTDVNGDLAWAVPPGTTPAVTIGPFGGADAQGLAITGGGVLSLGAADATHPGGVSTTAQTFGGQKNFDAITSGATVFATDIVNGRVGIGTATPACTLEVRRNIADFAGPIARYYNNGVLKSELEAFGVQKWIIDDGAGTTVGTLFFSSPLGNLGLGFIDAVGASRSDYKLRPGGGFTWAANAGSGAPPDIMSLDVSGNLNAVGNMTAANLSGTNTGNVTIGTANGLSIAGQSLSLQLATGSVPGALSAADWTTFNAKQTAITVAAFGGTSTTGITLSAGSLTLTQADATHPGGLSAADWTTFNAKQTAITIGTFGGSLTNGLTLSAGVLTLGAADGTNPGGVSTGTQTFTGNKTFTGTIGASNLSGTNTGDVTIGTANGLSLSGQALSLQVATTSVPGALSAADWTTFNAKQQTVSIGTFGGSLTNGMTISAGVLTLGAADGTNPGGVATTAQTFAGTKTFSGNIIADSLTANAATGGVTIKGNIASASGNAAVISDNSVALAGAADRIHSFKVNGVEKIYIDRAGVITVPSSGTVFLSTNLNTGNVSLTGFTVPYTNNSGTPGNTTINNISGRAAIANLASTCVVTNSKVVAASKVLVQLETTGTGITALVVAPAAGSFTVTSVSGLGVVTATTGATTFSFVVLT